jgi:hypothetical protein
MKFFVGEIFRTTLPNVFIVCYLLFAIFWNAPEINLLHKAVRSRVRAFIDFAGLGHAWDMYVGSSRSFNQIQVRVTYTDSTSETLAWWRRYEFRRYGFMIGNRSSPVLFNTYLRFVQNQLTESTKEILRVEVIKRTWKYPIRVGGVWGKFEIREGGCQETLVATWRKSD